MLYVITGPPAAGKTSWIDAHAKPTDIVIDLDRITRALAGPGAPTWNQDPTLLRVAHKARYAAMHEAFELRDKTNVYLIHTMPGTKALAKYKRMDAKIIAIDPGRDIVMQRIDAMRDPEMRRVASRWYSSRKTRAQVIVRQSPLEW
ncbi:AAA family ATPase [Streptomyces sp. NPDC002564]|uniref:AAA family ATPase n=1 Tax=Streptomyces sp. NPDC002564 TaxID=3364649 RepID=UPI0036792F7A